MASVRKLLVSHKEGALRQHKVVPEGRLSLQGRVLVVEGKYLVGPVFPNLAQIYQKA